MPTPDLRTFAVPLILLNGIFALVAVVLFAADDDRPRVDPAAWGSDHVGQAAPAYVTGDECLFCHRKIGPAWPGNPHQLTIRPADPADPAMQALLQHAEAKDLVSEVRYLIGRRRGTRFLKRSNDYGKLDMLTALFVPAQTDSTGRSGEVKWSEGSPSWDRTTFADRCAGCHSTAVDTRTRSFSAISLDCFVCHGDVDLKHTKDVSQVLLSSENREPRQVVATCGQCHLRGGKSTSSGLPYPNTFVAGDNLFRDYKLSLTDDAIAALPAVDQHVYLNTRDVAVLGEAKMDCITCHDVHGSSSDRHQGLTETSLCASCHVPGTDNTQLRPALLRPKRFQTHSKTCDY